MRGVDSEELPRVTTSMLRRVDEMCRRRLAKELRGGRRFANRGGDARFAVSNRVVGDARLAHADGGPPRPEAFVEPHELEPEQRHLYRAAVRGYLAAFGDRPGRAVDLGWSEPLPELGVQLVGDPGVAVDLPDGAKELRVLGFGGRRGGVLDEVDVHVALVRTRGWAPDGLRIVAVDLVDQRESVVTPHLPSDRDAAVSWLAARVARVLEHAEHGGARAGSDCAWCPFVAGCEKHA